MRKRSRWLLRLGWSITSLSVGVITSVLVAWVGVSIVAYDSYGNPKWASGDVCFSDADHMPCRIDTYVLSRSYPGVTVRKFAINSSHLSEGTFRAPSLQRPLESLAGDLFGRNCVYRHGVLGRGAAKYSSNFTIVSAGWPYRSMAFCVVTKQPVPVPEIESAQVVNPSSIQSYLQASSEFVGGALAPSSVRAVAPWAMTSSPPHLSTPIRAIGIGNTLLPTCVLWYGLLVDAAFYGGVFLLGVGLIAALRRTNAMRLGVCNNCSYPQGDLRRSPVCPECGKTHGDAQQERVVAKPLSSGPSSNTTPTN